MSLSPEHIREAIKRSTEIGVRLDDSVDQLLAVKLDIAALGLSNPRLTAELIEARNLAKAKLVMRLLDHCEYPHA